MSEKCSFCKQPAGEPVKIKEKGMFKTVVVCSDCWQAIARIVKETVPEINREMAGLYEKRMVRTHRR